LGGQLRSRTVQNELKLTAEQRRTLIEVFATAGLQPNAPKLMEKYRAASIAAQRSEIQAEVLKTKTEAEQNVDAAIRKLLNTEQLSRLEQLVLQARGPRALADIEVASKLKLTGDQLSKIQKLVGNSACRRGLPYDTVREVFDALSAAQKVEWKRLLGPVLPKTPSPLPGKTTEQTADHWFKRFDRNGDKKLVSQEWLVSTVIRREFTNDGLDLSNPMSRDDFVNHYLRIRHDK
jgi:hypothetical protein